MPFASAKQKRLFYAAASGKLRGDGPSPTVARKFIRDAGDTEPVSQTRRLLARVKGR